MDLTGKKVAVYGLGVSGLGALEFLQDKGLEQLLVVNRGEVSIWEDKVKGYSFGSKTSLLLLDENDREAQNELSSCDAILLSPGIPREHSNLTEALKNEVPVWNEIELGFQFLQKKQKAPPVLALTGTNGKTTCVTFLGLVLQEAGLNPFVGGNIGRSLLEGLASQAQGKEKFDCFLLEVSSFQCESLEHFRPRVAGILNLFPNHGERYVNVESYRQAKWLLGRNQTKGDVMMTGLGTKVPNFEYLGNHMVLGENISEDLEREFSLKELKLLGHHNRWNLSFCWSFLKESASSLGLELGALKKSFQKTLDTFPGVEHRLEFTGNWQGKAVYNDAKSTNWQATVTALKAVKERQVKTVVIIGGQLRGHGDDVPQEFLGELNQELQVVMFGESGDYLSKKGVNFPCFPTLKEVRDYVVAQDEVELVLFSPAFPSFDQFSNYKERGQVFKSLFRDSSAN